MKNPKSGGRCIYCGSPVTYSDKFCPGCGQKNDSWRIPGKDQCGNCHAYLPKGARYCTICGTRAGEGVYKPYQEMMQCIYGPMPRERTHVCENCGYRWTTCLMLDNQKYCPQCGGHAPAAPADRDEMPVEAVGVASDSSDDISFRELPAILTEKDTPDGSDSADQV